MTVLTPSRTAPNRTATPPSSLPISIVPPRGGVFDTRQSTAATRAAGNRARDTVMSAIWPLLSHVAAPAPGVPTAAICDASVARIRAMIANAVASFRARLGAVARGFDGAERVMVEDFAMTLKVDEVEMLDRTVGLLSPQDLVAAAVPGRTEIVDAIARAVGARVEVHMLGMVQDQRRLSETTKALVLFALSDANR